MKRKAYVTGADRGLGLGLVQTLLEQEYKVYAGSYMPEWPDLIKLKEKYAEDLLILPLDVSNDQSVESAAKIVQESTDYLNVIINNAGIAKDRSGTIFEKQYFEDIRQLFEVNALGPLRVTQSVLDLLLAGSPKKLVNISSKAGSVEQLTRKNQFGYTMSKAAINMQSKSMHNNLKDQGVKVLALHPGYMHSYLFGDPELMQDAPLEPIDSARHIVQLIHTKREIDEQIYMDYAGNLLPW